MPLKGVIFDMDGVIVNTVPLHFKAWKEMFAEYGHKFTFKDYKQKVDGIPRISGARAVLTDLSEEELQKAAAKKQVYFLKLLKTEGIKLYPDAVNLIKHLKKNKIKRAVISSSKNCRYILKKAKLDKLFGAIISGKDIKRGRGKPHPDIFLMAAKRLKLSPKECAVVEDALLGVIAAKRAKIKAIGLDRYKKPERLKRADLVVNNLRKLTLSKLERLLLL
jgi:beta-phosphoglucomutase